MNGLNDYVVDQKLFGDWLVVKYGSGKIKHYNAFELGCEWFKMSNNAFYNRYGFNFVPHGELFDRCRIAVCGGKGR